MGVLAVGWSSGRWCGGGGVRWGGPTLVMEELAVGGKVGWRVVVVMQSTNKVLWRYGLVQIDDS